MIYLHTICVVLLYLCVAAEVPHPLSDEFIDMVNKANTTWKAGRNFPEDTLLSYINHFMGFRRSDITEQSLQWNLPVQHHSVEVTQGLPENFDPREKWPYCSSLNDVRNQASCGSCWAEAAVAAMTDRVCIYSNGSKNFHFSSQDLISCGPGYGCNGAKDIHPAWIYWKQSGIVSGGPFNSSQGCRPFEIEPCGPGTRINCTSSIDTPPCRKTCEKSYKIGYQQDKHFGKKVFVVQNNEDQIRAEIYRNGPVETWFKVYYDFLNYKTGVYKHTYGRLFCYHAVKIMGWGVETGTKYWLIANSYGTSWGGMGGFFKFLRGENHCDIEKHVVAGEPLL
ncbi:hypothetical protein O0L34_g14705 [Tuta absoluta]|nr:hypothetical protein O0L34_g14705 [Tuta absoluta]